MDRIDRDTLARLAAISEWPCVSITLPANRTPTSNGEDRLRLRNLAQQAVGALVEEGLRRPDAEATMARAIELAADETFWTGGFDGVAVLVHDGQTEALRLPMRLPESMTVGDRLYLRPLYTAMRHPQRFWALALDRNGTRLFHGDEETIEQVDLPEGTPLSWADETRYDQVGEPQLQSRTLTGPPMGGGRGQALFHGHGGEKDLGKAEVNPFVRHLERGVTETVGKSGPRSTSAAEPLVLFGVDYLVAAYRSANGYEHLYEKHVEGTSGHLSPAQIREQALAALGSSFSREVERDLEELRQKLGTGLASDAPVEIASAAAQGRVKAIHFDDSAGPWGTLDRASLSASETCAARPRFLRQAADADVPSAGEACGWDLVDLAAAETLLHGGEVDSYTGEESPVKGVAAVFRY